MSDRSIKMPGRRKAAIQQTIEIEHNGLERVT